MKAVPKMEKFISQIKEIVFSIYDDNTLTIYDIIPILEDWKQIVLNRK